MTAALLCGLTPRGADAQTWTGARTTPRLHEIVAIDQTGEPGWPYGEEDVAGDGLDRFNQPEQLIDVRTVYAAADAQRLWTRAYVSDPTDVSNNLTIFVFIDTDQNKDTGGTAAAPEIDERFTSDVSPGGYEFVIGLRGTGILLGIW